MDAPAAILFPGQGSQAAGMLSAYGEAPQIAAAVREAGEAIGEDLAAIMEGDGEALNQTVHTQPAMLAIGVGVYRAAAASGRRQPPVCFAGHSLGEYSALVCAGALPLADAAQLVRRRAQLMQNAVADGGMAAVLGLSAAQVEEVCAALREEGGEIWPANYNSEVQTVVAGRRDAVAVGVEKLKEAGAKRVVQVAMSVPSHCPLMQEAADALLEDLRAAPWQTPAAPVLHSAPVADDGSGAPLVAQRLAAQLTAPIHWQAILREAAALGAQTAVECGPGKVLCGLGKKSALPHLPLNDAAALAALSAAD